MALFRSFVPTRTKPIMEDPRKAAASPHETAQLVQALLIGRQALDDDNPAFAVARSWLLPLVEPGRKRGEGLRVNPRLVPFEQDQEIGLILLPAGTPAPAAAFQ